MSGKAKKRNRSAKKPFRGERLEPRCMLAADPVITEFMASNDATINDGFGRDTDWIEIQNLGDELVDLEGYNLTDTTDDLAKWTFSQSTVLEPGEALIVFASSQDTVDPLGFQHTNFKLGAGGEYLALTSPTQEVLSEFGEGGVDYPPQITDVSFGIGGGTILTAETTVDYLVPQNGTLGNSWRNISFSADANGFQAGSAALGYENDPNNSNNYDPYIETELPVGTTSVFVRHEFQIPDASSISGLDLNLLFDDGVVVHLNGQQIISENAPPTTLWNSTATDGRNDSIVLAGVDYSLDSSLGLLQDGDNVITFQMLNTGSNSSDFLLVPTLTAESSSTAVGFLGTPTPGFANSLIVPQGPVIRDVESLPESPAPGQPVVVTAEVQPFEGSVDAGSVELTYRHMFNAEITIGMRDDGLGEDEVAGDNIYSAVIPGSTFVEGEMTRWYVTADDTVGLSSRSPRFVDPVNSPEYYGTVVVDSNASSDLPVLYWFVENEGAAQTRQGTRASMQLLGEFYDNIQVDLHGQSTAGPDFPKKSFDFDSNNGQKFRIKDGVARSSDFNLLTNYGDQSKVRHPLAYEVHRQAGLPTLDAFSISVHRNGSFFGLYDVVEEVDEEFLERVGLDSTNPIYKVNNRLDSAWVDVEKKTGLDPSRDDFQAVVDAEALSGTAARTWHYDNLDLADMANYFAANILMLNTDFGHKNMLWYRDTSDTELWSVLAWDVDLSFGHRWNFQNTYFDNGLFTTGGFDTLNDTFARLYADPRFSQMLERRVRTLMDQMLGPAGTPVSQSFLAQQINERRAVVADEAVDDLARWGRHPNFTHTPASAASQLLNSFLPGRRSNLESQSRVPDAHGHSSDIRISQVDHNPASGDLQEQYVRIENRESFAVDISGWTIGGSLNHTFKPGTVIPANGDLYLAVHVPSFKQRSTGPRGGQQRILQGADTGPLSPVGGQLTLSNANGAEIFDVQFGTAGDFDADGEYACNDVDQLTEAIAAGTNDPTFDMTADGVVDQTDLSFWLAVAGSANLGPGATYLPGDATLDGVVDASDFNRWNANKFTTTAHWCSGDFTADGVVDASDFNVWNANKFTSSQDVSISLPAFPSGITTTPQAPVAAESPEIDLTSTGDVATPVVTRVQRDDNRVQLSTSESGLSYRSDGGWGASRTTRETINDLIDGIFEIHADGVFDW